jgi:hypothetical protein
LYLFFWDKKALPISLERSVVRLVNSNTRRTGISDNKRSQRPRPSGNRLYYMCPGKRKRALQGCNPNRDTRTLAGDTWVQDAKSGCTRVISPITFKTMP